MGEGVPYKENGGMEREGFTSDHAYEKHKYDPDTPSTEKRTQYGKDVDVDSLVQDTIKNPDSVQELPYGTKYSKSYDGNISTEDTPTGEHRVFENKDNPDRSSNFPYYRNED